MDSAVSIVVNDDDAEDESASGSSTCGASSIDEDTNSIIEHLSFSASASSPNSDAENVSVQQTADEAAVIELQLMAADIAWRIDLLASLLSTAVVHNHFHIIEAACEAVRLIPHPQRLIAAVNRIDVQAIDTAVACGYVRIVRALHMPQFATLLRKTNLAAVCSVLDSACTEIFQILCDVGYDMSAIPMECVVELARAGHCDILRVCRRTRL
jgi:hypothetical protein